MRENNDNKILEIVLGWTVLVQGLGARRQGERIHIGGKNKKDHLGVHALHPGVPHFHRGVTLWLHRWEATHFRYQTLDRRNEDLIWVIRRTNVQQCGPPGEISPEWGCQVYSITEEVIKRLKHTRCDMPHSNRLKILEDSWKKMNDNWHTKKCSTRECCPLESPNMGQLLFIKL